ncbi:MAG: hypothetical protein R3D32_10835 [Nitratireductor sp.]
MTAATTAKIFGTRTPTLDGHEIEDVILAAREKSALLSELGVVANRTLIVRRDELKEFRKRLATFVERRSTGALRKSLGIAATAGALVAGLDNIRAMVLGANPVLAPQISALLSMLCGAFLLGCWIHGLSVRRRLQPVAAVIQPLSDTLRRIEVELDRRLERLLGS